MGLEALRSFDKLKRKIVGVCNAHANVWEALTSFEWCMRRLSMTKKKQLLFLLTVHIKAYSLERLVRCLSVVRRWLNFFPSFYFLSLPSKNMVAQPKLKVVLQFLFILIMTLILFIAFNLF